MTVTIVVLAVCLLLEAFFSGGELALISADRVKLRHHAEGRGRRGAMILRFLNDPGQLISTSLVGTNICVVLSTAMATVELLPRYPGQAELLSLGVMMPLVLVFGEIVPKSICHHYADVLAPPLIYVFSGFRLLFLPAVVAGSAFSRFLMRRMKLDPQRALMSREELRLLIQLPNRQGADPITPEERQLIANIFEFSDTRARDVMLPLSEVTAVSLGASISDVAREIADKGHTRLPVYRERVDQIEGIVHGFDILRAATTASLPELCRAAIFIPENQPVVDTLVRLQREGQGMAIVVDEYGGATGVVTIEDIIEEIVGDIQDEYDDEGAQLIRKEPGGAFRVLGRAPVQRLNDAAKLQLPTDEDYETVAGLVLDRLKRIPSAGEQLTVGTTQITVLSVTERAVEEVRVQPLRKKPAK